APLHLEPVDLRAILEEARETGELLAEQAGVRMDLATPPEPVIVPVDASRIRQLILNLVTNAVKYTPSGGSVRMQLGQANGRVTLTVADTGVGIAGGQHLLRRRGDAARRRRRRLTRLSSFCNARSTGGPRQKCSIRYVPGTGGWSCSTS